MGILEPMNNKRHARIAVAFPTSARVAGVVRRGYAIPLDNQAHLLRWNEVVTWADGSAHGVIRSAEVSQLLP